MIPMSVISGYLGAGKTTFLNRLLSEPTERTFAVLVNDFGEIAVDEQLISYRDGQVVALRNGCVCCQIGDDLLDAIDAILQSDLKPDHILLEASGVSHPGKLIQIARAEPELVPAGVLTLVDAVNHMAQRRDPLLADTLLAQIAAADQILVTKTDLVGQPQLATLLAQIHSDHAQVSIALAADAVPANLDLPETVKAQVGPPPVHPRYETWSYRGDAVVDAAALEQVCAAQAGALLRLKGFVKTDDDRRRMVHFAGRHWTAESMLSTGPTELVAIGHAGSFDPRALAALTQ